MAFSLFGPDASLFTVEPDAAPGRYLVYLNAGTSLSHALNPSLNALVSVSDAGLVSTTSIELEVLGAPQIANATVYFTTPPAIGDAIAAMPALNGGRDTTYAIVSGNESGAFAVDQSGLVALAQSLALSSYTVGVRATDSVTGMSATATLSVSVLTLTLSVSPFAPLVLNQVGSGYVVATVTATSSVNASVTFSGSASSLFQTQSNGQIALLNALPPTFENTTEAITVTATDSLGGVATIVVTIPLVLSRGWGLIDSSAFSIPSLPRRRLLMPGMLSVSTLIPTTSAPSFGITAGNVVFYSSAGGTSVQVSSFGSSLITAGSIEYELTGSAPWSFTAIVSYPGNSSIPISPEQVVTPVVTTIANAAPIVLPQFFSIDEDVAIGTVVGQIVASDPNSNPLTFTLLTGESGFLVSASGQITTAIDWSVDDTTDIELEVSVSDGLEATEAVMTVSIYDKMPEFLASPAIVTRDRNLLSNGYILYEFGGVDPNDDVLTFSIESGNANNWFSISSVPDVGRTEGPLVVANSAAIYADSAASYELTIKLTDETGRVARRAISVVILRVGFNAVIPIPGDRIGATRYTLTAADLGITSNFVAPPTYQLSGTRVNCNFFVGGNARFWFTSAEVLAGSVQVSFNSSGSIGTYTADIEVPGGTVSNRLFSFVSIPVFTIKNLTTFGLLALSKIMIVDAETTSNLQLHVDVVSAVGCVFKVSGTTVTTFNQSQVSLGAVSVEPTSYSTTSGSSSATPNPGTFEVRARNQAGRLSSIYSGSLN